MSLTVASDKRKDLDVPKNVQLYGIDHSGHVIPIMTDLSGEMKVDVTIGDIIAVVSGNVTASLSSGEVHITSGQIIAKVSGEVVSIASGGIINRDLLSGLQVISQSGLGVLISGQTVTVAGGVSVSGNVVRISGETIVIAGGVNVSGSVIKISGEKVTLGKSPLYDWIFSGYGATNTMVYSGVGFIADKEAALLIYDIGGGSGINYTVRGYLVSGILPYTLVSGTVNSGSTTVYTVTDPYSWIEVGTANTQANFSGVVTVVAARV